MRSFSEYCDEHNLQEFLNTPTGTLYYNPGHQEGRLALMVRYFNRSIEANKVQSYANILVAMQGWVDRYPSLAALLRIEPPTEVGQDFIARRRYSYHVSTRAYAEWDNPPEPPVELWEMRMQFCQAAKQAKGDKDNFIVNTLSRSILEPSSKTFFEDTDSQFIVVDISVMQDDLEKWDSIA